MATNYVLELLQSGERIRGKSKIRELHANFPSRVHFVTHRVVGEGDHWVWEGTISFERRDANEPHRRLGVSLGQDRS